MYIILRWNATIIAILYAHSATGKPTTAASRRYGEGEVLVITSVDNVRLTTSGWLIVNSEGRDF